MKIVSTNVYVGPNIYAHFPVIRHVLDLEGAGDGQRELGCRPARAAQPHAEAALSLAQEVDVELAAQPPDPVDVDHCDGEVHRREGPHPEQGVDHSGKGRSREIEHPEAQHPGLHEGEDDQPGADPAEDVQCRHVPTSLVAPRGDDPASRGPQAPATLAKSPSQPPSERQVR